MKRKCYWLSLLALALILVFSLQPAFAYLTASARLKGSVPVTLGYQTRIYEKVEGMEKSVQILNTKGAPVWIRARAYAAEKVTLEYDYDASKWTLDGGWYYYNEPVAQGEKTSVLKVKVTGPTTQYALDDSVAGGLLEGESYEITSFNVGVHYESIPVKYTAAGEPIDCDPSDPAWTDNPLDFGTTGNP